ncbi:MAG: geranylgeranyl pyrophosphate synthase [Arenicella sp.]|jgi:geranylgeranyl pyrophosphate synthase
MGDVMLEYQARNQRFLEACLDNADVPERLRAAMRYSTLSGGKRFRALLVYASGLAVDAPLARLDAVAAALECIHAYSLIHDDLPAMDDDDLRRGQATSHIKYDEATAILAGDALQTLAFELIASASSELTDAQARRICLKLAQSSGQTGMVGGQILDIQATEGQLSLGELEDVHRRKTGALINAAVICGALCSDYSTESQLENLSNYANNLGLAFQVVDDILDIESSTEELGKPSGSDIEMGKSTYPALIGLQESKKLAQNLYQESIVSIAAISDNTLLLEDLAKLVVERTK